MYVQEKKYCLPVGNEWGGAEEQEYGENLPAEVVCGAVVIRAEDAAVVHVSDPVVHEV